MQIVDVDVLRTVEIICVTTTLGAPVKGVMVLVTGCIFVVVWMLSVMLERHMIE